MQWLSEMIDLKNVNARENRDPSNNEQKSMIRIKKKKTIKDNTLRSDERRRERNYLSRETEKKVSNPAVATENDTRRLRRVISLMQENNSNFEKRKRRFSQIDQVDPNQINVGYHIARRHRKRRHASWDSAESRMPPVRQSKLHHVRLRLRSSLLTIQFTVLFQEQRELSRIIRPFSSFHSFTRPAISVYRIALATESTKTNFPREIYIYRRFPFVFWYEHAPHACNLN